MGKRGNGEGSVYQRKDGRWVVQYLVYLPSGPKYRYIYAKTRKAAADKLTEAMADRNKGIVFHDENLTVSDFLSVWLSGMALRLREGHDPNQYLRAVQGHRGATHLPRTREAQAHSAYPSSRAGLLSTGASSTAASPPPRYRRSTWCSTRLSHKPSSGP